MILPLYDYVKCDATHPVASPTATLSAAVAPQPAVACSNTSSSTTIRQKPCRTLIPCHNLRILGWKEGINMFLDKK